jgi:hypothetical protein
MIFLILIGVDKNKTLLKIKEGKQSNDVLKYLLKENVNIIAFNGSTPFIE